MIDYQIDAQGIATLTWDMPGRSQNVMNGDSLAALYAVVERAVGAAVKGILFTSGKADFAAGGDLEWLLAADSAAALMERMLPLHRALRQLETCGKPGGMALTRTTLGGG